MPVFFAMSFVVLAALSLDMLESVQITLIAALIVASMIAVTCMLVAESRHYDKRSASHALGLPLHRFARRGLDLGELPSGDRPQPCARPHDSADKRCHLCSSSDHRLRLGCLTCESHLNDCNDESR